MTVDEAARLLAEVVDEGRFTVKLRGGTGDFTHDGSWELAFEVGGDPLVQWGSTGTDLAELMEAARESAVRALRGRVSGS